MVFSKKVMAASAVAASAVNAAGDWTKVGTKFVSEAEPDCAVFLGKAGLLNEENMKLCEKVDDNMKRFFANIDEKEQIEGTKNFNYKCSGFIPEIFVKTAAEAELELEFVKATTSTNFQWNVLKLKAKDGKGELSVTRPGKLETQEDDGWKYEALTEEAVAKFKYEPKVLINPEPEDGEFIKTWDAAWDGLKKGTRYVFGTYHTHPVPQKGGAIVRDRRSAANPRNTFLRAGMKTVHAFQKMMFKTFPMNKGQPAISVKNVFHHVYPVGGGDLSVRMTYKTYAKKSDASGVFEVQENEFIVTYMDAVSEAGEKTHKLLVEEVDEEKKELKRVLIEKENKKLPEAERKKLPEEVRAHEYIAKTFNVKPVTEGYEVESEEGGESDDTKQEESCKCCPGFGIVVLVLLALGGAGAGAFYFYKKSVAAKELEEDDSEEGLISGAEESREDADSEV